MVVVVGRCRLRQLLKERKMSQSELARLSGRSRQKISDYVNDKKMMSYETALDIAFIIGCLAEDLYVLHLNGDWQKK